jgi:hypothetical protein
MYGRFCIKFPQSRMKGERHSSSVVNVNINSNAISYVTSNFIGQLHLQVRINLRFTMFETVSEY